MSSLAGMGPHHLLSGFVGNHLANRPVLNHGLMVEQQLRALMTVASELQIPVVFIGTLPLDAVTIMMEPPKYVVCLPPGQCMRASETTIVTDAASLTHTVPLHFSTSPRRTRYDWMKFSDFSTAEIWDGVGECDTTNRGAANIMGTTQTYANNQTCEPK